MRALQGAQGETLSGQDLRARPVPGTVATVVSSSMARSMQAACRMEISHIWSSRQRCLSCCVSVYTYVGELAQIIQSGPCWPAREGRSRLEECVTRMSRATSVGGQFVSGFEWFPKSVLNRRDAVQVVYVVSACGGTY